MQFSPKSKFYCNLQCFLHLLNTHLEPQNLQICTAPPPTPPPFHLPEKLPSVGNAFRHPVSSSYMIRILFPFFQFPEASSSSNNMRFSSSYFQENKGLICFFPVTWSSSNNDMSLRDFWGKLGSYFPSFPKHGVVTHSYVVQTACLLLTFIRGNKDLICLLSFSEASE